MKPHLPFCFTGNKQIVESEEIPLNDKPKIKSVKKLIVFM
jgi:hypothetical protein